MKAMLFAVVSLLFVASLSAFAEEKKPQLVSKLPQPHIIKINLNKADARTLTHSFKGIGEKRAQAIVRYREQHGHFRSLADLAGVRGLGKSFVIKNLPELQEVFETD